MPVPPKLSIPRRIFLGFALVLTVSVTVSVASFVQHQRSASALSFLHDGLLPLALSISEVRAAQNVFNTLLDRVLFEYDNRATLTWFKEARRRRPAMIDRAITALARVERLAPESYQQPPIYRLRHELRRVQTTLAKGDERYEALFASLDAKDKKTAELILKDLRGNERTVERQLGEMWEHILRQIEATSASAAEQQRQSIAILAGLIVLSLAIGVAVTWWSQRMLSPLPKLQERVEAVARGEFVQHLEPIAVEDEIGRLAREFERMVVALAARDARLIQSERLASIGRMAAHVTHEVRSPLSSIGLNVELLEEEIPANRAEARTLIAAIKREIESLNQITEEYLRLARLPNPRLEPESLEELTRATVAFLKPELASAGIEVALAITSGLPLVAADEGQIRQVLKNLLKNAREAMPKGGTVNIEIQAYDGGVAVIIRDHGVGMTEEQRQHVFELFYTTKSYGSGLGLPLSKQIIVSHRGRIHCDSQPGHGTAFEVWLPAVG